METETKANVAPSAAGAILAQLRKDQAEHERLAEHHEAEAKKIRRAVEALSGERVRTRVVKPEEVKR